MKALLSTNNIQPLHIRTGAIYFPASSVSHTRQEMIEVIYNIK